jgi:hypothetical protein
VSVGLQNALAGDYQRDSQRGIQPMLAIHRRTMEGCAGVFVAGQSRDG